MAAQKLKRSLPDRPPATVLVVEDNPILRFTLALELKQAGYRVREAGNADEAEALLKAGPPADVIITDVEMPGAHDGLDLARAVRAKRPQTKVIVVSGTAPATGVVGVADAFFGKPYDVERVILRVRALLGPLRSWAGE